MPHIPPFTGTANVHTKDHFLAGKFPAQSKISALVSLQQWDSILFLLFPCSLVVPLHQGNKCLPDGREGDHSTAVLSLCSRSLLGHSPSVEQPSSAGT